MVAVTDRWLPLVLDHFPLLREKGRERAPSSRPWFSHSSADWLRPFRSRTWLWLAPAHYPTPFLFIFSDPWPLQTQGNTTHSPGVASDHMSLHLHIVGLPPFIAKWFGNSPKVEKSPLSHVFGHVIRPAVRCPAFIDATAEARNSTEFQIQLQS